MNNDRENIRSPYHPARQELARAAAGLAVQALEKGERTREMGQAAARLQAAWEKFQHALRVDGLAGAVEEDVAGQAARARREGH